MKLRFELTVELDESYFMARHACDPEEVRTKAACEFAADLTETDFWDQFVKSAKWHRMAAKEIPFVIEYASEKGRSIRVQMELDDLGAFS
ncbi:hypothetical protein [Spirillospora sp. NPDC047279]|uniref:hypothetical protein n=1 Tax=Spirillospora sp. NPDC047279 TaxID=3155478 RepID=UPI0033D703B3